MRPKNRILAGVLFFLYAKIIILLILKIIQIILEKTIFLFKIYKMK